MRGSLSDKISEQDQKIGFKLLVYMSSCLTGHAYPMGFIPHEVILVVWDVQSIMSCGAGGAHGQVGGVSDAHGAQG